MRWCPGCEQDVPEADYVKNASNRTGFGSCCKACARRRWRERSNDPKAAAERTRKWRAHIRMRAIEALGGVCTCCAESESAFLVVDHIDGGGTKARGTYAYAEYQRIIKDPDPIKYQVLCANCNMAKERAEGCPHQKYYLLKGRKD